MAKYEPIIKCAYGPLDPKVNLEPDFFTGFQPEHRREIVTKEAAFYRELTRPYWVDDQLIKDYIRVKAADGYEITVKIYRPKNSGNEVLPAVAFFHGGGYMTCSVETHDYVPSYLAAKAGVMCFNVEYRLAPEHKFPTGLEDCYTVCKWIAAHADELHIDPNRLAVSGDSSGGNFAAVLCLMAKERKDLKLWRQILIYPCTEMSGTVERQSAKTYTIVGGKSDGPSPMLVAYLNDMSELTHPWVSPMLADDLTGLPPALFIEAECDALADDGLIYAKLLQDAGVPVECHVYNGMPHAFILRTYEETFAALDTICGYLKNEQPGHMK